MHVRFVKVDKMTQDCNWWNHPDILGKTFEALEISAHNLVRIQYFEGFYGWLPVEVCEVNPHLKLVKNLS